MSSVHDMESRLYPIAIRCSMLSIVEDAMRHCNSYRSMPSHPSR